MPSPRLVAVAVLLALPLAAAARAQGVAPDPDDVYVRVVDGGAALCTITRIPRNRFMVYDAGHWTGSWCRDAVRDVVGPTGTIDLLILSHSDSDHLGEAAEILAAYAVKQIIWTGAYSSSTTWQQTRDAIEAERQSGATVQNLRESPLVPGTKIRLGGATVTLVAGWPEWPGSGPDASELRNVISIVVRLEYEGHAVLYTGDTIGRRRGEADDACRDAELYMVLNAAAVPVASDVIIAPHHGGDNGSATCFIQAVSPTYVIFSAGHQYDHPSWGAARRYLNWGVPAADVFRTDFGDDESANGDGEWAEGRVPGCSDKRGEEDVEIALPRAGAVRVGYRQGPVGCAN